LGTSTEKYAYAVAMPSVQCAAVSTTVEEISVPVQRWLYAPSPS
jgi:hypothetical protein